MLAKLSKLAKVLRSGAGEVLKLIGLVTVGNKVTGATSGFSDAATLGVLAVVIIFIFGGRR